MKLPTIAKGPKATGLFLAGVFLLGALVSLGQGILSLGQAFLPALTHPYVLICLLFSGLLAWSAFEHRLVWIQPVVFVAGTFLSSFTDQNGSGAFYSLAFFATAILLLFRQGFFLSHRVGKFSLALVAFFACQLASAGLYGRPLFQALAPLFFVAAFLLLLYFSYESRLMVYLKEPKPLVSLASRGLTPLESEYLFALIAGSNAKEMAVRFAVSESTVRNNIARCFHKLGIEDRHSFVLFVMSHEIVA